MLLLSILLACESGSKTIPSDDTGVGNDSGDSGSDSGDTSDTSDTSDPAAALTADPERLELGTVLLGTTASSTISLANGGEAALSLSATIDAGDFSDAFAIGLDTATLDPGASATLTLDFTPATFGVVEGLLTVADNDVGVSVGIPVTALVVEDTDGDGYGSVASGGDDCDDTNIDINPGATEVYYDDVDQNCDGANDFDADADGFEVGDDCDDTNAAAYPGAVEVYYNGVDEACDGGDDYDRDADGFQLDNDCDDADVEINPGAVEVYYDGVDQNCDGLSDNDADIDGYDSADHGGDDCDDTSAAVNPGATEVWYDGVDQNCDGANDNDQDADGVEVSTDCDDTDPVITAASAEILDGHDNDCDGLTDDLVITSAASGTLTGGAANVALGTYLSLGGNLVGDSTGDLVAASPSTGNGYAWVVSGSSLRGATGAITAVDTAEIQGERSYNLTSVLGPMLDVGTDGTADLLITGYSTSSYTGRAYLFQGGSRLTGAINVSTTYTARLDGDSSNDMPHASAQGDIDGDGVNDVVLGSPYDNYTTGGGWGWGVNASGNLSIFLGGRISGSYDLYDAADQINGQNENDYLGWSANIADMDGDGYGDILSGAPGLDVGGSNAGGVYIFAGNADGTWDNDQADSANIARIVGATTNGQLGLESISRPADIDGDGSLDLLLSSRASGQAWIFWDGASIGGSLTVAMADITLNGSSSAQYGAAATIWCCSDDADGAVVAIGAPLDNNGGTAAGAIFLYTPTALSGALNATDAAGGVILGAAAGDNLGAGLATGADVTGDGKLDLVAGAPGQDTGGNNAGAVYLIAAP